MVGAIKGDISPLSRLSKTLEKTGLEDTIGANEYQCYWAYIPMYPCSNRQARKTQDLNTNSFIKS